MKYIKALGLLAVAAAALMVFAGGAWATSLTSSTGETPTLTATSPHPVWHNQSLGTETTCTESTLEATVESHGAGQAVRGKLSKVTFGSGGVQGVCGSTHYKVLTFGSLSIVGASATGNGTVSFTGTELTTQNTSIGISCIYKTSSTHIGTLTGGVPAVLTIESALIPRTGHSFFCGSHSQWTGQYTITHPSPLTVH